MATLYLETTVPSYLTARASNDAVVAGRQAVTRLWWDNRRSEFELRVSQIVLDEASAGDSDAARRRLAALAGVQVLPATLESDDLATDLAQLLSLPPRAVLDAAHLAVCIIHRVDYLLTWNCRHIANAVHRRKIERFCFDRGVPAPVICTPDELQTDDES